MKLHIQSNAGGASPATDANMVIDLEGVDSPITPLWCGGISQTRSGGNIYLVLNALIVGVFPEPPTARWSLCRAVVYEW